MPIIHAWYFQYNVVIRCDIQCYLHSDTTWEPASALPQNLVSEFETGIMTISTESDGSSYGHTSTTLIVTNAPLELERKKTKRDWLNKDGE